jgi:hypothetical protein
LGTPACSRIPNRRWAINKGKENFQSVEQIFVVVYIVSSPSFSQVFELDLCHN